MIEDFTIVIASDGEHENVFAEIYCVGRFVALVSQEQGVGGLQIEFPPPGIDEAAIVRTVNLEAFRQALTAAVRKLTGNNSMKTD